MSTPLQQGESEEDRSKRVFRDVQRLIAAEYDEDPDGQPGFESMLTRLQIAICWFLVANNADREAAKVMFDAMIDCPTERLRINDS